MNIRNIAISIFAFTLGVSCNKNTDDTPYELSYGASIFYLKPSEYTIYPTTSKPGTYSAFPEDGIDLKENTGAIRIKGDDNNIFTGLKYKITHTAPNGDTSSTVIMVSGITFLDKFYNLSQNDSVANPIYNGSVANILPISGSTFDDNNLANASGCSVKTTNGQINLAETVRNGFFGTVPQNDAKGTVKIEYKLNDASNKAQNKIEVKLYYYKTMADVTPELWETLNERQLQGVFLEMNNSSGGVVSAARLSAIAKPRPPCVIIIGQ